MSLESIAKDFKTYNLDWSMSVYEANAENAYVRTLQKVSKYSIIIFIMILAFELIVKNAILTTLVKIVTAMGGMVADCQSGPAKKEEITDGSAQQPKPQQPQPQQQPRPQQPQPPSQQPVQPKTSPQQPPAQPKSQPQPKSAPQPSQQQPPSSDQVEPPVQQQSQPQPQPQPQPPPQQQSQPQPQAEPQAQGPILNRDKVAKTAVVAGAALPAAVLVIGGPAVAAVGAIGGLGMEIFAKTFPDTRLAGAYNRFKASYWT